MSELVLFCNCSWSDIISDDVKQVVLDALKASGRSVVAVDDLCRLAVDGDERFAKWAKFEHLTVVGCFRRTVEALFLRAGVKLPANARVLNMQKMSGEDIISELGDISGGQGELDIQIDRKGDWMPWFPVIDYGRCIDCKQCLNFCLFGVFKLSDDGKVVVERPANCKMNCPACARVCPEAAIIFPKYGESPINGDEVDEEALKIADKSKALADLMDGDVHEIIRSRSKKKKRFAPLADGDAANSELSDEVKAAKLAELQEKLAIPQGVIDALAADKQGGDKKKCPNFDFCDKDCDPKS